MSKNTMLELCKLNDLVAGGGMAALVNGHQIALFYLPNENPCLYAIDNFDPLGGANVLSRGIVGDIGGELVVASPLYKQHFSLLTGQCLEDKEASVHAWPVLLDGDTVMIEAAAFATRQYA